MSSEKKVVYTDSAKKRLENIHEEIDSEIESAIRDRKFIPGESVIEVTASDIHEISEVMDIQFRDESSKKKAFRRFVVYSYLLFGVIIMLAGLFFDEIINIIENPTRAMLLVVGMTMTLASIVLNYYYNVLERKRNSENSE